MNLPYCYSPNPSGKRKMFSQPFFQVALPIMASMFLAAWVNGKAIDTMNKRLDDLRVDISARLGRIEDRLTGIESRLSSVELKAWR